MFSRDTLLDIFRRAADENIPISRNALASGLKVLRHSEPEASAFWLIGFVLPLALAHASSYKRCLACGSPMRTHVESHRRVACATDAVAVLRI